MKSLTSNPLNQFKIWYEDAMQSTSPQPDAMVLATATRNGYPSARIVLFKGMNPRGLRFFTNYLSRKGKELSRNPRAALVFYWPELGRQVRIEGKVKPLSPLESDEYWKSRPKESRIGALASKQSAMIKDRQSIEKQILKLEKKYPGSEVPRPDHWGGYVLIPQYFEFWILGDHRIHDRFSYQLKSGKWKQNRLAP